MKKILTFIFAAVSITAIYGQQIEQYSNYNFNNYLINPAVGGAYSYWNIRAGVRNQWVGLQDNAGNETRNAAPRTLFASFHGPLGHPDLQAKVKNKKQHHGVGGYIFSDATGAVSYQGFFGSYSYFKKVNPKTTLSLGIGAGLKEFRVRGEEFYFVEDPVDDLIGASNLVNGLLPDLNLGLWVDNEHFFGGVSIKQLLRNKLITNNNNLNISDDALLRYHYYVTGGLILPLSDQWTISPSVMLRVVYPAPIQADFNLRMVHVSNFSVGASYRYQDAVSGIVEYVIDNKWEIGYAFDYTTSEIRNFSRNTHEIILGVRINQEPETCPRKFW